MLLGISMYWTVHSRYFYTPVIHLHVPVCPPSQTHKFPKGSTTLFLHASIRMQKITMIMTTAYVFSSLNSASDRMRRYGSAGFANIHIIRAFFPHKTEKNVPGLDLGSGQLAKYHWIVNFG